MKISLFLFFFFFALCIQSANLDWKSGYLVTHSGDTIRGMIGYQDKNLSWEKCLFRLDINSPIVEYTPTEVSFCVFDSGLAYEAHRIKNSFIDKDYFVRCLLKGIISLYVIDIKKESETYSRYLTINSMNGRVLEIVPVGQSRSRTVTTKRIKKTLELLFDNHPDMKEDINKTNGGIDEMISIFSKYHKLICNEEMCVIYKEEKKKNRFWITPSIGGQMNLIKYSEVYWTDVHNYSDFTPVLGVIGSMNLDKQTRRWLLNVGLEMFKTDLGTSNYYHMCNQTFKFKSLNLLNTIGIEYRWLNAPYALLETGIIQKGTFVRKKIATVNNIIDYDLLYRKYDFGVYVGVGFAFPLKQDQYIPVKKQYRKTLLAKMDQLCSIDQDMLTLTVGYTFRVK